MNEPKTHKRLLHVLLGVAFLITSPQAAFSAENWQTLITATVNKTAKNRLTIGQNEKATDGMDNFYDVKGFLAGDIIAYLQSSKGPLWQEIKGSGLNKSWTLKVSSNYKVAPEKISFKISLNNSLVPSGYTIYLRDNSTGSMINLTQKGSYSFSNANKIERTFTIESVGSIIEEDAEEPSDEEVPEETVAPQEDTTLEPYKSTNGTTSYRSPSYGVSRIEQERIEKKRAKEETSILNVSEDYESYYKPSTKKLADQIAGKLKKPSNLRGWIKKKTGLYLEWDDNSGGEHGFIIEKKCGDNANWSLIAALWGVRPTYSNDKTTMESGSGCHYRIIAFNHITESDYSDIVTFSQLGDIEVIEKKEPLPPIPNLEKNKQEQKEIKTKTNDKKK